MCVLLLILCMLLLLAHRSGPPSTLLGDGVLGSQNSPGMEPSIARSKQPQVPHMHTSSDVSTCESSFNLLLDV